MFSLAKTFSQESVIAQADFVSNKRVLEALSQLLAQGQAPELEESIFQTLVQREKLGSTALGYGIAIPHARLEEVTEPHAAVITLKDGIEFDSPDGKPVDIFIGLAIPGLDADKHLAVLAQLTKALREADFRQALRDSNSNAKLYNAMLMATVMHEQDSSAP